MMGDSAHGSDRLHGLFSIRIYVLRFSRVNVSYDFLNLLFIISRICIAHFCDSILNLLGFEIRSVYQCANK